MPIVIEDSQSLKTLLKESNLAGFFGGVAPCSLRRLSVLRCCNDKHFTWTWMLTCTIIPMWTTFIIEEDAFLFDFRFWRPSCPRLALDIDIVSSTHLYFGFWNCHTDSKPISGAITIPIAPVSFTPFPVPTDTPINGAFPEAVPSNPPPVREAPGLGGFLPDFAQAWNTAKTKAKAKIAGFTLEQKVNLTTGVGFENGRCVGNTPPVADFPGFCLQVCPHLI